MSEFDVVDPSDQPDRPLTVQELRAFIRPGDVETIYYDQAAGPVVSPHHEEFAGAIVSFWALNDLFSQQFEWQPDGWRTPEQYARTETWHEEGFEDTYEVLVP